MRFRIRRIPLYILVAVNLLMVVAMNVCAYTTCLNSQVYPDYSYFGMVFPVFLLLNLAFLVFWLVFKRRYMLVSLVGMLACAGDIRTFCPINYPANVPDGAIKVMSYNVMGFGGKDTIPWEENEIVQYILDSRADIVCLQEFERMKGEQVHQLFDSVYPHIAWEEGSKAQHLGVLSKYPILSQEQIEYDSKSNGSYAYRILVDGDTVLVVNNHLESYKLNQKDKDDYKSLIKDPESEDSEQRYDSLIHKLKQANTIRAAQADSIVEYIRRNSCEYVVCLGDFNAPSLSYTHYRLTRILNDAYTRSGNGVGFSYNRSGMYFRIDNILISPNITSYRTKVDAFGKRSDHYPIISYLKFGAK